MNRLARFGRLLLYGGLTAALWPVHLYFRDHRPGAGPDGGEAILTLLLLIALLWTPVAAWNAARLARRRGAGIGLAALAALGGAALMAAATAAVFAWPPATVAGFALAAAGYLAPNLIMDGLRR